jgi:hypothetical protein
VVPREWVVRGEIEIPESMDARAPRSISLDRPFGRFESTYSVAGRRLTLTKTLKLARRSVSDKETYEAFRKAIDTDSDQEFALRERSSDSHDSASASPSRTETRDVLLPKNAVGESVEHEFQVDEGFIDAELTDIPEGVTGCYPFCGHDVVLSGAVGVSRSNTDFKPGAYEVSVYYYRSKAPRTRDVNVKLAVSYAPLAAPSAPSASGPAAATVQSEDVARRVRDALRGASAFSPRDPGIRSVVAMGRAAVPELLAILREASYGDPRQQLYFLSAGAALSELATDEDLPALASLLADGHVEVARGLEHLSGPAVREALLVPLRKGFCGPGLTTALGRFESDPEVQDAVVAYLDRFGTVGDLSAGDLALLAGRAGIRAAVPVLTRLIATVPPVAPARRMFASALTSLHEAAGVQALVDIFSTTAGDKMWDQIQRHLTGEALNNVVGDRVYVGALDDPPGAHGNFEEAAERFRAWWTQAHDTLHWDEKLGKWAWDATTSPPSRP